MEENKRISYDLAMLSAMGNATEITAETFKPKEDELIAESELKNKAEISTEDVEDAANRWKDEPPDSEFTLIHEAKDKDE